MRAVHLFRDTDSRDLDLGALFSASQNAYVVFDQDLRIVGCNEAYLKAVGRSSREEIVGHYLFDAFPADPQSDSYKLLKGSLDRVIATGQPDELALVPYDVSRPGEPSRMRYWSATHTPLFSAGGELRYILQHTTDVTELQTLREQTGFGMRFGADVLNRARQVQRANQTMLAESDMMRRMFEQAPGFLAILHGPAHVFQIANAAYRRLVGGRDVVGLAVRDALPEVVDQGFLDLLDKVRATGQPFIGERVPAILQGELRVLDFIYQPLRDHHGEVTGIFVQGNDLTEQFEAQMEVERQAEFLRLAQEAGGFGTFEWIVETGEIIASPAFKRLYGFTDDESLNHVNQLLKRIHPEDASIPATNQLDALEEALQPREYRVEVDGETRWLSRQGVVLRDPQGRITRVLGASHDITGPKQWQAQLETLARESTHRVKNVLALAQAIVEQTLRRATSLEEARRTVSERISALAASQTALVDGSGTHLDLRKLVEQAMQLHGGTGQVRMHGPDVRLDSRTALGLGLALHELATNAVKYGALSTDSGEVEIGWCFAGDTPRIELLWEEHGGPPVEKPERAGFGMRLIERSLAHDRRNRAKVEFPPEGVRCTCSIALPED